MAKFTSRIYKIGINPVVDPPDNVLETIFAEAGRSKGPIPVRGNLNGAPYTQTLVRYSGAWRLYINGIMLKESGLKVGEDARIEIEFDPAPRDVEPCPALAAALRKDRSAKAEFDKLKPSRQKEILKYLGSLKTEASIQRNVERVLLHLRNQPADARHGLMRRGKTPK